MDEARIAGAIIREHARRAAGALALARATVVAVSNGLVQVKRPEASTADGTSYPRLAGFALEANDEVLLAALGGEPVVLGRFQRSAPAGYALEAPLAVPAVRLTRPRWAVGARPNPGAASVTAIGTGAWTLGGTAANADDATGPWVQLATTATTGSVASLASPQLSRIDWATAAEPVELVLRLRLNQTADLRFWCGLFSGDPSGSNTPALSFVGFRYVGGSDADFRCYSGDGTNRSQAGSGVAPDTSAHEYRVVLEPARCRYLIDGTVVGELTTNLPASGVNLAAWITVTNLASAVRSWRFGGAAASTP